MFSCATKEAWSQFLEYAKRHCSPTAFSNWLEPIRVIHESDEEVTLEVPNIFVKEYLLSNYKKDLCAFLPVDSRGEPALQFIIAQKEKKTTHSPLPPKQTASPKDSSPSLVPFNKGYRFETFIEGPTNRFVKSAAMGVAVHPGRSYNPFYLGRRRLRENTYPS